MALAQADLQQVIEHVRSNLHQMLLDVSPQVVGASQLLERTIRVEEELKSQRETMEIRFASLQRLLEARFEVMDNRFAAQHDLIAARFEAIDKRFETVDRRFEAVDKRFEAVDKRFEDLIATMNKRFEAVDKRFEDLNKRFTGIQWMVIVGFVLLGTIMSILGLAAS